MTPVAKYSFKVGEPIVLGLRVLSGNPAGYAMTAKLKSARFGLAGATTLVDFRADFVSASGSEPAHWLLTIDADESALLPAEDYLTDAVVTRDGVVQEITPTVGVTLTPSISL